MHCFHSIQTKLYYDLQNINYRDLILKFELDRFQKKKKFELDKEPKMRSSWFLSKMDRISDIIL